MQALGLFFGLLYGWIFVDMLWTSLLSMAFIPLLGKSTISATMASGFGSNLCVQIFLLLTLAAYFESSGLTKFLANWFVSRKIAIGRPWVLVALMMVCSFILSAFTYIFASIVVMWGIIYHMAELMGYKKQDAKSSLDLKEDINLGIAQIDSYLIFQSHLLDIKKEYPNITLRLLRHSATEIMQNIKLGRYRIGTILAHPDDVAAIEESLSVFSLNLNLVYEDQVLLYINQENPLAQQPMVTVSELLQYSFCGYSQLEMWRNDSCSFFATGFNEKNVVHVDTAENILNLVSQDRCCYGVMFESWRTTSCFPQNIVTKPIQEYKDLHINHYLFYPEEKRMSFGEKMIFDKVQAAFQLLN
jgi:hypothetical protein